MNELKKFFFIANNSIGDTGLSGGDRIYIELARAWKEKADISIVGCEEASIVSKREGLTDISYYITSPNLRLKDVFSLRSIFLNFFIKLARGLIFVLKKRVIFRGEPFIYSVSDFYPDSLPAFLVKLLNPKSVWIAGFYLFAPTPWQKDNPYKGRDFFRGFLYWLSQKPIFWIINTWADFVFVTSEPDRHKFITKNRDFSKIIVIKGGVNITPSTNYLSHESMVPVNKRKYDSCFVGRFHQQKGISELIDIWAIVVRYKPDARLAMIGNGPLEEEAKTKAREIGIYENIDFFGFLDGEPKFEIFKQSKMILHPATFDSGGMAAAEAMAWRLPGVSFDLEALETYYPRGMSKIPLGDKERFAEEIVKLLTDQEYYAHAAALARNLVVEEWDWKKRAEYIYSQIMGNLD